MASNRMAKGPETAEFKGKGSTYVIPADDMPENVESGEHIIAKIYGIITIDEGGGVIEVERIEIEKINSRDDPLQKNIEDGLTIDLSIKK